MAIFPPKSMSFDGKGCISYKSFLVTFYWRLPESLSEKTCLDVSLRRIGPSRGCYRILDCISQFADVSWPVVVHSKPYSIPSEILFTLLFRREPICWTKNWHQFIDLFFRFPSEEEV